jgi:hypothetical protein
MMMRQTTKIEKIKPRKNQDMKKIKIGLAIDIRKRVVGKEIKRINGTGKKNAILIRRKIEAIEQKKMIGIQTKSS